MKQHNIPRVGGFPTPLVPQETKKSDEYGLMYAKAIESEWFSKRYNYYQTRRERIEENRAYAKGKQNISRYKQLLNATGDTSLLNLDWSPIPVVKKFVKVIVNSIMNKSYELKIRATDPIATSDRDELKNKLVGMMKFKDFIDEVKETTGQDISEGLEIPDSMDELEMILEMSFKQAVEIAAELAVELTFDQNDYPIEIRRKVCEDLVVIGMGATKTYFDPYEGIKVRYVDPKYFISSHVKASNFKDMVYAGEIIYTTIGEIKREVGDKYSEAQYYEIAQTYAGKYDNPSSVHANNHFNAYLNTFVYEYDDFTIPVVDFEFVSVDDMNFEKKRTRHGNAGFYKKNGAYEPPKNSKYEREKKTMTYKTVYAGKKILGADVIWSYGLKENMLRPKDNIQDTWMSYHVYAPSIYNMVEDSIVETIRPMADQVQLIHLKIQQLIARVKPYGLIIDVAGLNAVSMGDGGELTPLEIQDIYEATGVVYYRSRDEEGNAQGVPIQPLPAYVSELPQLVNAYNFYINEIRNVTGVVPEREGITRSEQLVGVTQMAVDASNTATYDIDRALNSITKGVAKDIIMMIQDIPKKSPLYKYYVESIGKANVDVIESMDKISLHNFGVNVEVEPDDKEKFFIEQHITTALSRNEIRIEDAIVARKMTNTNQAHKFLSLRRKKYQKEQMEIAQQNSMMQAQANQQTAIVSSQAKTQELQVEGQMKAQIEQLKSQAEIQKLQAEYQLKSQLSEQEFRQNMQLKAIEAGIIADMESFKEDRKDDRTKIQASQQSKLIDQRKKDSGPVSFQEPDIESLMKMAYDRVQQQPAQQPVQQPVMPMEQPTEQPM